MLIEKEKLIGSLQGEDNSSFTRQSKFNPDIEFFWIVYTIVCTLVLLVITCLFMRILEIYLLAKLITGVAMAGTISALTGYILFE